MILVRPTAEHLPSYVDALTRGYSPSSTQPERRDEELRSIEQDPGAFLAGLDDPEGLGPAIPQPDGSLATRLPGFVRWMWEDEFVGSIGFRWQPGSVELPPHVLGHIGYGVVTWRRREGHATRALAMLLADLRESIDLPYVTITCDADNDASRRVIESNGGIAAGQDPSRRGDGGPPLLRFEVPLR